MLLAACRSRRRARARPRSQQWTRVRPPSGGYRPRAELLEDRLLLAAGALDPSFGTAGVAIAPFAGSTAVATAGAAVQADGKIVVAINNGLQQFVVQRFNADGGPDLSFGTGGSVTTPINGLTISTPRVGLGVVVQPDGKIVVLGETAPSATQPIGIALVRYGADGSLDPSFGQGGLVLTPSPNARLGGLALQPDGKIVVAGGELAFSPDGLSGGHYDVWRFNADGSADAAFGTAGKAASAPLPYQNFPNTQAVALQPDGKIVVAAESDFFFSMDFPLPIVLLRFTPSGSPDPTFDDDGLALYRENNYADVTGLALQADGKIVFSAKSFGPKHFAPTQWTVGRANSDGSLDTSFGTGGFVAPPFGTDFPAPDSGASGVTVQPDGKLVVAGTVGLDPSSFELMRYTPDGNLDPTFGSGGQVASQVGTRDSVNTVVLQGDGILVAGMADGNNVALLRYQNDVLVPPIPLSPGERVVATGADAGGGPNVQVFDAATDQLRFSVFPYDLNFHGGTRVAVGDVNADGVPDLITAPGPSGGPDVHVYDGTTGRLLRRFYAFAPEFFGGLYVAAGDVNADGFSDIVIGADAGGGANVAIFDGQTTASGAPIIPLVDFFPYGQAFTGGVRVAAGDVDGDGHADLVCGAGPGGGPNVSVISGADGKTLLASFFPYAMGFRGGVYVAAGDADGDGVADLICGAGPGGGPNVAVISGADFVTPLSSFFPYDMAFPGGVRVGVVDRDGDGRADVVCVPGPGGGPDLRTVNPLTGQQLDDFFAYSLAFAAGLYVAGG